MRVSDVHRGTIEHDAVQTESQPGRFGRLAPSPGGPASGQVRCSCDRCGAHLLAVPQGREELDGSCPVCLGLRFTPVEGLRGAG